MRELWYKRRPEGLEEIRRDLREKHPNLHLHVDSSGAEVRGTFSVRAPDGRVLDEFRISIQLPSGYPKSLPVVRELGGRIPWSKDFHVHPKTGVACVLMPDDRWRCFPEGGTFDAYLDGPLYNFFLSQIVFAETGKWPFGQWNHEGKGIYEYYRWLLETEDDQIVERHIYVLAKCELKKHYECPCGSGKKIKRCCLVRLRELREKIPASAASRSLELLGLRRPPYERSRIRQR